jgi:hypothetical protein
LLRDYLARTNHNLCLGVLVAAAPAIATIGGSAAVRLCAQAVMDVYRWWQ